jgi:hypothetical protein
MAESAAARLGPLQQWHAEHTERVQHAAIQAAMWWASKARVTAAVAAATGRTLQGLMGDSSARSAGEAPTNGTSSSSSEVRWPAGDHDHNPQCPLCQQELQQQLLQEQEHQEQQPPQNSAGRGGGGGSSGSGGSSSASAHTCWPVAYDDPFLWRRLMWGLLGKLSAEAQAFYANTLGMCPHACDHR